MTDGPGHWTNEMLVFFLFLWFLSCYLASENVPMVPVGQYSLSQAELQAQEAGSWGGVEDVM